MSDQNEEFIFNAALCARVSQFRKETGMSAEQMATLLGVPAERYRKYEFRSVMPPYLFEKFCLAVRCDIEHLILGKARSRDRPQSVAKAAEAPLERTMNQRKNGTNK